jgi:hypothetical protein
MKISRMLAAGDLLPLRRGLPLATLNKALAGACRAAGVKPVLA